MWYMKPLSAIYQQFTHLRLTFPVLVLPATLLEILTQEWCVELMEQRLR